MKKIFVGAVMFAALFLAFPRTAFAIAGDLNADGNVNLIDFDIIKTAFTAHPYTIFDFNNLVANFGKTDPNRVKVGAIFFNGTPGRYRNEMEGLLAFPKWQDRWPYYTVVRSKATIDIHESDQRVIDQEIKLAADAGLDYWSFLGNPNSVNNYGLNLYMKSPNKYLLKFTIMGASLNAASLIPYLNDPQYLRVTNSQRPLLYVHLNDALVTSNGGVNGLKNRITSFVNDVEAGTGKKPVLVAVDRGYDLTAATVKNLGFEDVSWYLIMNDGSRGGSYESLAGRVVSAWNVAERKGTSIGLDVVPLAVVGFDPRPKALNPLGHAFGTNPAWTIQGTPQQIANHIKQAVDWIKANPAATHTKTALIYAWNENAEGGWLMPITNNQRLNAISRILGGTVHNPPTSPFTPNTPAPHPLGTLTVTSPTKDTAFQQSKGIAIRGVSPMAARITFSWGNKSVFLINGKTGQAATKGFSVTIPSPPPGTHNLRITSPDTSNVVVIEKISVH